MNRIIKRKKYVLIMLTACILSITGCSKAPAAAGEQETAQSAPLEQPGQTGQPESPEQKPEQGFSEEKLLASALDNSLKLYYDSIEDDYYKGFYLVFNGTSAFYDWEALSTTMFMPELYMLQGTGHAAVKLLQGEGTGMLINEIHAVDLSTLEEIPVEHPYDILEEHMDSSIDKDNDEGELLLDSDKTEFSILSQEITDLYDKIAYEDSLDFFVEEQTLYSDVNVRISPVEFIGHVRIKYKYEENTYRRDSLEFIAYEEDGLFSVK